MLAAASPAHAVDCSAYPGGVIDGDFVAAPSQIQVDQNCTLQNFPASNPLNTNFSFQTQPGQTDERWLVIFDNVVHTGQMSCNTVSGHTIWFTNSSSTEIQEDCQNLLIPVEKIDKQNPAGTTTATVGVPYTYTLTSPVLYDGGTGQVINNSGSLNDLHGVELTDDLNAVGGDLTYVSHVAYWRDSLLPVSHTFTNVGGVLTFDLDPIIPAGDQVIIELTVVLEDTPANAPGTQIVNTAKWKFGRLIDGTFYDPLPGEWGISEPLTIANPDVVVTKTGPATLGLTLNLGQWGDFAIDVQNTGLSDAWDLTIVDQLPDGATGGMCDVTPQITSAQVFESDGSTPAPGKTPLAPGVDYSLVFTGAPTCEMTLVTLSANASIAPGERLIIGYRTQIDPDSQDGISLTNVAGAAQWFNGSVGNPARQVFDRTVDTGSPGTIDHQDLHTVTTAISGYFFEKTVENLDSGANPATTAEPGDWLRYSIRLQATDLPLSNVSITDDLGSMNGGPMFVPGSLTILPGTLPPGSDASGTQPNGGSFGTGLLDVQNIDVAVGSEVTIQFDIQLAPLLPHGTVVLNQADLVNVVKIADSDDPFVNGQSDPAVPGDEDPTQIVVQIVPAGPLQIAEGQATATIGEIFNYRITVPAVANPNDMYDVRITSDLLGSAANLRFIRVDRVAGSLPWTPVNSGSSTSLVIEDTSTGIDIPAGEQIEVDVWVVLEDTVTNVAGLPFDNTATFDHNWIDGNPGSSSAGEPATTPGMVIVEPDLIVAKSGPAAVVLGVPAVYTLDVTNGGTSTAWHPTLADQLPNLSPGGMCDVTPSNFTARVYESNGTTTVSPVLVEGTDFTTSFVGDPTCELTIDFTSDVSSPAAGERLIVTYETLLDFDTPDGAVLDNVAGATTWYSTNGAIPEVFNDRRTYAEALTDGTVGFDDHQDAHSIASQVPLHVFEKTVGNVTTSTSPTSTATPGDQLEYTITIRNVGSTSMDDFTFVDELDRLNGLPAFVPGTLAITSPPVIGTVSIDPAGGAAGTGSIQVSSLNLPNNGDQVTFSYAATLASVLPDGSFVNDQAALEIAGQPFSYSDDPIIGGPSDPNVTGDEDPTQVQITSTPVFLVEKSSADMTGDPATLLSGDTLRYTLTIKNVGTDDAFDATLVDALPVNTTYVSGTTTLNGAAVADPPGGALPLATGIQLYAPENPTPGAMRADASATPDNVATLTFDVVVDAGVADGTVISNQAFVSALTAGVVDVPSDDPATPIADDPTRNVVGSTPLLFASKDATLVVDNGTSGVADPLDVIEYTIRVFNTGAVAATDVVLQDLIPANTTYVSGFTALNGAVVPDAGGSPLVAGLPISSSDLAPPLPGPGAGTISPGGVATVTIRFQIADLTPAGTLISNQATVTSVEAPALLTDGDGNPSTGPEPTVVVVGAVQLVGITKQVSVVGGGPALPGSTLEYVVIVTNVGPVDASNVVITDDLDTPVAGQLTYVPASALLNGSGAGVGSVGSTITADYGATFGDLAVGAQATLRFRAVLDAGLAQGTVVQNVAQVDWSAPILSDTASVSISVGGLPGVSALSGRLWHDADFDGVVDAGEPLLAGWLVDLVRNGQTILTAAADATGAYAMAGLQPNDATPDQLELVFRAPDATASSAALGTPLSPFTNLPQRISDVVLMSGGNLLGIDLGISPNGVVYDSVNRFAVGGATLTLLNATTGVPVPASCFDDPVQQGQISRADGHYKFDLNFFDAAACPAGGTYLLDVVPPVVGYTPTVSVVIPPTSDAATAPLSVPTCGLSANDAVPTTPLHCEPQASIAPPPTTVPPQTPGTTYHVHMAFDASQGVASSQIFNNHVPVDPIVDAFVGVTKTTPKLDVVVGELVPYEIVISNQLDTPLTAIDVVDRYPAGFKYLEGSARIDGVAAEPTRTDRDLTWAAQTVAPRGELRLQMLLAVGAGVVEGEYVNSAWADLSSAGLGASSPATATVRVTPDPDFACTDVMGKVFDDRDLDGEQDEGEAGLSGIRLITTRGLAATTDAHGRFHITCAVVPREDRGSNFQLKLDERSLPAGYRLSTPVTQVKRATRGKALRFRYGAALHRVVSLDVADPVFEPGSTEIRAHWLPRIDLLVAELEKAPSTLRLSYAAELEKRGLVESRLAALEAAVAQTWRAGDVDRGRLRVETEIFWAQGEPPVTSLLGRASRGFIDALKSPFESDEGIDEVQPSARAEQPLPDRPAPTLWARDPERLDGSDGDRIEVREVVRDQAETQKLRNVVAPIRFESGEIDIPEDSIEQLRGVLAGMEHLDNVRLHLVGHADTQALSPAMIRRYGDNYGLSRERAGEVAEFVMRALALPPESISFDGMGADEPIATNATEAGRRLNRRVEVEVWYDEMSEAVGYEDVVIEDEITQVKVCRTQTVCKMRLKDGHERRARIRNLVAPLQVDAETVNVPDSFIREIARALENLQDEQNVTIRFIGYSDDGALSERAARIYGNHQALSTAQARRVALAVQEALALSSSAVISEGRGTDQPIASNSTERGRTLNRRVEIEFWHDDPLQEISGDPQICPDAAGEEILTRVYDPPWGRIEPIPIEDGEPIVSATHTTRIQRALADVSDRRNARVRFVGYVHNEGLDRRTALAYDDDIGLSAARARRTMERVQAELSLPDERVEHEGRGYVHSNDIVNAGFIAGEGSEVRIEVVYDEQLDVDELEGVAVTSITRELEPQNPLALNLMRISIDGVPIDDPGRSSADIQRCTDVALDDTSVRFGYDEFGVVRRLTITAEPHAVGVGHRPSGTGLFPPLIGSREPVGDGVQFRAYSNYAHFIDQMEVRVFDRASSTTGEPIAIIPVDARGEATWAPPAETFASPMREMKYLLRVYDSEGRFDETVTQPLWLVPGGTTAGASVDPTTAVATLGSGVLLPSTDSEGAGDLYAGYGEAWPIVQHIPLGSAGTVRVEGEGIGADQSIAFAGVPVPTDGEGRFAAEQILPSGVHTVELAVEEPDGTGELFLRDLELDASNWFFTGIADVTFSGGGGSGDRGLLEGQNSDTDLDSHADGRLAFFLQGKFGDGWQLTAAADTEEGEIGSLFGDFLDTSPDRLFRRIQPEYHYPTFGDDGTVEELAPTQGKMFARLQHEDSHLMWGDFIVAYDQNELALVERGLYGANVRWRSTHTTDFGEKRFALDGFVADAGTLSEREAFRGTGGSLYYLRRNDLTIGSERLRIEIRDKDSGNVKSVVHLSPGIDYDVDYLQGRVLLSEPLTSTVDDSLVVRTGGLSGDEAWLVVQYEYAAGFGDLDALNAGGQGHYWLGELLKLGFTASHDEEGSLGAGAGANLYGADVTLRHSAESWAKFQYGRSDGVFSSTFSSDDGGFDFASDANPVTATAGANSYRADVVGNFADFVPRVDGTVTAYAQHLDAGYAASGLNARLETNQAGGTLAMPIADVVHVNAKADWTREDGGIEIATQEVDVDVLLTDAVRVSVGFRNDDRDDDSAAPVATQEEGRRTDLGVEVEFDADGLWRAYAFGQGTVSSTGNREDNLRYGAGGEVRVSDRLSANAEVSGGEGGVGTRLGTTYQNARNSHSYLTYGLENERSAAGSRRRGNLISGSRSRFNDSASVFAENRYTHSAIDHGLVQAAGIESRFFDRWTVGANIEIGTLSDRLTKAETRRRAAGGQIAYHFADVDLQTSVEYRKDDTQQTDGAWSKRTTWLFGFSGQAQLSPSWRLLTSLSHSFSKSSLGDFYDGGFTEAVFGYAYRPVQHDDLHVLAKYTYFYNLPTTEQTGPQNVSNLYAQRSHIAAVDLTYDLTSRFSLGGKYAYRSGQISLDRVDPDYFSNDAHLFIVRADYDIMVKWEMLAEGRALVLPNVDERKAGALLGIYRYFGEHFKAGVGYNFTDFSEDLTDLSYDHHGWFINMVGSF